MNTSLLRRARALALCLCLLATSALATPLYETLRPGTRGTQVLAMQQALNYIGFSLKADGAYGDLTRAAVQSFQKRQGLEPDGLAGKKTLNALYKLAPQFAPQSGETANPPTATKTPTPGSGKTAYVITANKGSLNLRSAPRSGAATLVQIPYGEAVLVLGKESSWSRVQYAGRTGYAVSSFLSAQPPVSLPTSLPANTPAPVKTPTPVPGSPTGPARVSVPGGGKLNLRHSPAYSNNTFYQLANGAAVTVTQNLGEWSLIRAGTRTGYVVTSFLRFDGAPTATPTVKPSFPPSSSPSPSPTPAVPPGQIVGEAIVVTLNGRTLNFRSAPREEDGNIIAQIPSGEVLPILSKSSTWCKVVFKGSVGYVRTSFLTFAESTASPVPSASPTPTPEPETVIFPRTLKEGMSGDDVRELQERLIVLKYNCRVNGAFDAMTKAAVAEFQRINALKADGVFGSASATTLLSPYARPADSAPLSYKTLRIDNADSGSAKDIANLQTRLKELGYPVTVNGRFDIPTHQAVVAFQWRNGLTIEGVATAQTQAAAFSAKAKGYSTSVSGISADEGKGGGPATSQVKLLHWFKEVKPSISGGQQATVYHPSSNSTFTIRFYSLGRHADSEPLTWRDTQIMNRAFGTPSWNINAVYVKLPDGRWTLAAMHNRPHLTGSVNGNGFGGHLCIHFLRDMDEVMTNDPDYGASNQRAIRKAWKGMTGEDVE